MASRRASDNFFVGIAEDACRDEVRPGRLCVATGTSDRTEIAREERLLSPRASCRRADIAGLNFPLGHLRLWVIRTR